MKGVICNRSFMLGAVFAYGTVLMFIMAHFTTPQKQMEGVHRRRPYASTARNHELVEVETSASLPLAADCCGEPMEFEKARHEFSKQKKTEGVILPRMPSSPGRPTLVIDDAVDNLQSGTMVTMMVPDNTERVRETPPGENDGYSRVNSGRAKISNVTVIQNHSTPKNIRCPRWKRSRKYDPALDCGKRLPHVIGIGVEKCGSGSLTFFLRMHPNVAHSSPKELYYWNKHVNESLEWYRGLMPMSSKYQVTMEYTPSYIFGRDIPRLIKERAPETKFIVMLRNPIKRAVSHFLHVQYYHWKGVDEFKPIEPGKPAHPFINETFETTVVDNEGHILEDNAIIENGLYNIHLQRWFDVFSRDRFLIVDGDEFSKDPMPTLRKTEAFLDLPSYFNEDMIYFDTNRGLYCRAIPYKTCLSKSKGRTHPTVRDDVVQKLTDYYHPHNLALNSLLGRNFSWTYS